MEIPSVPYRIGYSIHKPGMGPLVQNRKHIPRVKTDMMVEFCGAIYEILTGFVVNCFRDADICC